MNKKVYLVAIIRPWNIQVFRDTIREYPGAWHLITNEEDLTPEKIKKLNPRYIFFPHWSHIVPQSIIDSYECVCFHETDVPFGQGGSPIQNLIVRGYKQIKISALRMAKDLDGGPVYFKHHLSLQVRAEDIYIRSSKIIAGIIKKIITKELLAKSRKEKSWYLNAELPNKVLYLLNLKPLSKYLIICACWMRRNILKPLLNAVASSMSFRIQHCVGE